MIMLLGVYHSLIICKRNVNESNVNGPISCPYFSKDVN